MTAISWANGVNGDWSDSADWSTGTVPGILDSVTIAAAGSYTVTIMSAESAASIALDAGGAELLDSSSLTLSTSLTVSSGTLGLASGSVDGGTITVGSDTTLLSTGSSHVYSALYLSGLGSLIVSSGTLTVSGLLDLQGYPNYNHIEGPGTLVTKGTTILNSGGLNFINAGLTWSNAGTVISGQGTLYGNGQNAPAGNEVFTNEKPGNFDVTGSCAIYDIAFTNLGTVSINSGADFILDAIRAGWLRRDTVSVCISGASAG